MKKTTLLKSLSFFIMLFGVVNFGFGQSIFTNPIIGTNPGQTLGFYTTNQVVNGNITVSGISKGSGIAGRNADNRYNAINWDSPTIDLNDYFEFTLTPNIGYEIDFVNFVYNSQRSPTGPPNIAIRSSLDSYATDIATQTISVSGVPVSNIVNLSSITYQNIASIITFRIYAWGGTDPIGSFSINDFTFNGAVSVLPCATSTTYDLGVWSSGLPNSLTKAVIINDNYDTSAGNITACSLTVNAGVILTVSNNTFVEVQNDITVDVGSEFLVQSQGAVIQIDDSGNVTNNGITTVVKTTAPANNWYEYTYWSSPVKNETIGNGLFESQIDRRFSFTAQNFIDATKETGNNNATVAGQDDIDDNGDDWIWVSGSTVMLPGVGYASTHDKIIFNSTLGNQIDYSFEGPFNNGVITVPLYRNDASMADNNWNFIGNPYPSAISADLFLAANSNVAIDIDGTSYLGTGYINGAIFLWSQNTAPSSTTNGNQVLNFSNDDYAIINAVGENAGGDGVTPSRLIPSGQGFFVSMSDTAPATFVSGTVWKANSDVVFNNSMRVKGASDNSQFFKNTNTKGKSNTSIDNKLWVNLTSDNGIFNQILVGYVNGATNDDDGASYDAAKYPSKGVALYTTIEGSSKKFAIQGKNINSISEDEIINLGFKTSINVATLYKLSVAQLQGDFLTNNSVYLKDNLLNKVHNLSASDYTFTSAVGEFNSRFEIGFKAQALSTNDLLLDSNSLKIVELQNDFVQFTATNNLSIKTVNIYDLLGRQLYSFKGANTTETYKLSNLNNSIYIAKVALSNGAIVTKKAIKK